MTASAQIPAFADLEHRREFALWARSYDEVPNPLLSLEERYLATLLPELSGNDVVDVGCGTGRWLERICNSGARSLTGVDSSSEMLHRAKRKVGRKAVLKIGHATSLPIASQSADVVLVSFVASYVARFEAFARELRRIVRPGGRVFISDIHPETAEACHWKRGFRTPDAHVQLATCARSVVATMWYLRDTGFRIASLLEPPFDAPELEIFRSADKLGAFHAASGLPAIYILQAQLAQDCRELIEVSPGNAPDTLLRGARIALDPETTIQCDLGVHNERVDTLGSNGRLRASIFTAPEYVPLHGYMLLPGLINAHDHLEFGLYPNLGKGPYRNATEWALDIQCNETATIQEHQSVSRDVRLWWGGIRNLLCGVTTVCHHNPLHPELLNNDFPVRVVTNCAWAHSLAIDRQLQTKFTATSRHTPFVIHACEGLDQAAAEEVFALDNLGAVKERTILVHGLAITPQGISLLNARGAAMVWCPSSNHFLFGRTHTNQTITSIGRVLLGSDSPLTAIGDLLDEVRFARDEAGVSASRLYRMLSDDAADAFRLQDGEGSIRANGVADLIAVHDRGLSPAEALAVLNTTDVELVMVGGRVQLASAEMYRRLPTALSQGLRPLEVESTLRWVRAPLGYLFREAERVLGSEIKLGGKRVRHVSSAWL